MNKFHPSTYSMMCVSLLFSLMLGCSQADNQRTRQQADAVPPLQLDPAVPAETTSPLVTPVPIEIPPQTDRDAKWKLVWSDEFEGSQIDESKWNYEVKGPGWVNNELQNYTFRRQENARVENGHLVIQGNRDYFEGKEYSSARLKTQGKASWTYGRVEARIQLPAGRGTWPAFWMMPDDQSRGWPACGEIDIMEHVGYDQNRIHGTTHSLKYNWKSGQQRTASTYMPDVSTGYHNYAMEWSPDRVEVFVDNILYFVSENDRGGDDSWPFDKNFHIILNLAIGGDWGAAQGVDATIWPQRMLVDYVRVYQK